MKYLAVLACLFSSVCHAGDRRISSSVYLNGCSGTVISKGEKYAQILSCAHCFNSVDSQVYVYRIDGKATKGTVFAIDSQHDLSLIVVAADFVLDTCPIPERFVRAGEVSEYSICGYPNGVGPTFYRLSSVEKVQQIKSDTGMWRWVFSVDEGNVDGGNSGSGLYVNDMLYGVVSHRNTKNGGKTLRAAPHRDVLEFVKKKGRQDCGNGFCAVPEPGEVPPPAPDSEPTPAPKSFVNAPKWTPKPNPGAQDLGQKAPAPYDGRGRPPADLRTPHQRSSEIDKLRHEELDKRIAVLEAQLVAVHSELADMRKQAGSPPVPGERGTQGAVGATGPAGPAGPPGKDVDPKVQDAINKRLAALETFVANLTGQRLSGKVMPAKQ